MQPITGRADHRADRRPQRRSISPPVSSDPATAVLPEVFADAIPDTLPPAAASTEAWRLESEDPLAGLREDDLGDEEGDGDVADDSAHRIPGRSALVPLGAAVVLAVVGAVCLLPIRLPWEAPVRPAAATTAAATAAGLQTTPPTGNADTKGNAGGGSASSSRPSAPTTTGGGSRPARPPAALDASAAPTTPPPASTAAAGVDPSSMPTPEDTLAGPVSDQVLQDLLTSSLPPERTITDPTLLASADGQKLLEVTWQALAADVEAGGWTQPRQQAHAVLRTGRDDTQAMPIVVDVVVMWAALDGQGELTERELSTVRVSKGAGSWTAGKITTASEGN